MKLLNPDFAAREKAILEARLTSDEAKAADAKLAAQRLAFERGRAETAEQHDLWSKDLKGAQAELEKISVEIARFDLLEDTDEGRELNEALENLVVAFSAAMRIANARAGEVVAGKDARADEISLHLARARGPGAPVPVQRNSQRIVWSRLQEKLRAVVAKAAKGHEARGEHGIFLLDLLRAGLDDAITVARRTAALAAAEKARERAKTRLESDRWRNPIAGLNCGGEK
jgi:hypothetical protein